MKSWAAFVAREGALEFANCCDEDDPELQAALDEAIAQAKLDLKNIDLDRVGILIGSGIGSMETLEKEYRRYIEKGAKKMSPHFIPKIIINEAAGQVSIRTGARGPATCVATACSTATNAIESVRPITADVLIKAADAKVIDVNLLIVLLPEFTEQEQTVKQDAIDAVTSFLNASSLGTTVDASDVINVLYSVNGIDRVRVVNFSVGDSGNLLSMTAAKNEYLSAGTVTITVDGLNNM